MMEKAKIIERVVHFVAMSGSTSVIETLQSELVVVNRDLELNKAKLKVFSAPSVEGKYFDSVAHVLDISSEVTCQTDIEKSEKELAEETTKKEAIIQEEETLHGQIERKRENLNNSRIYVESIKVRIKSLSESDPNNKSIAKYQTAVVKEEERQGNLKKELEGLEKRYKEVQDKLLKVTANITELEEKLEKLNVDLTFLRKKLSSKKNYENHEEKEQDDNAKKKLQEKIGVLEARKEEILKDPVWLADELEGLLASGAKEDVILSKIDALFEQVEKLPYMDLKGNQASAKAIGDELTRLLSEKEELEAKIATGDYETSNNEFEKKRTTHLEKRIAVLTEELKEAHALIEDIDTDSRFSFATRVKEANEYLNYTESKYEEYKTVMEESEEDISTERRAELQLALDTKESDVEFARDIYQKYLEEKQKEVKEASLLTSERIPAIEHEMALINTEILEINDRVKSRKKKKQKDIVAITKDKAILEELNDKIAALNHRKQFEMTPVAILTELKDLIIKKQDPAPAKEKPQPAAKAPEAPPAVDKPAEKAPVPAAPKAEEKPAEEETATAEVAKTPEKPEEDKTPKKEEAKPEEKEEVKTEEKAEEKSEPAPAPQPAPIVVNEGFLPNIDSMN